MFDGSIASESILGLVVLFIFFSSFVAVALVLRKALEMLSFNIVSSSARLFADLIWGVLAYPLLIAVCNF